MTTQRTLVLAGLLCALALACRAADATEEQQRTGGGAQSLPADAQLVRIGIVDWYVDYDEGLRAALELERPLWVHFGENPG